MATDDARTGGKGEGALADRLRQFGVLPTVSAPPPERGAARAAACGSISLSGVGLLVPTAGHLFDGGAGVGFGLAVLGTVVAVAVGAVGGLLYRSTISTRNTVRIAAWNFLGIAVLGGVMLALFAFQRADGGVIQSPTFVLGTLLTIGAGAHLVIGVYDARRVRAEQLAPERRRTAVLNGRSDTTSETGRTSSSATPTCWPTPSTTGRPRPTPRRRSANAPGRSTTSR